MSDPVHIDATDLKHAALRALRRVLNDEDAKPSDILRAGEIVAQLQAETITTGNPRAMSDDELMRVARGAQTLSISPSTVSDAVPTPVVPRGTTAGLGWPAPKADEPELPPKKKRGRPKKAEKGKSILPSALPEDHDPTS
jgi:hypothetical protein